VKILGTCRVADALGDWGSHNTAWRARREITDAYEGVDFALTYYADYVSRILAATPFGCLRVHVFAEDVPQLYLHDKKRTAESLTEMISAASGPDADYVLAMAAAETRVVGPLTCTCQGAVEDATLRLHPRLFIFDGWHRAAAWILQGRAGKIYPILANVILTEKELG